MTKFRARRTLTVATGAMLTAGLALSAMPTAMATPKASPAAEVSPAPVAKAAAGNFLKLWSAEWMAGQRTFSTAQAADFARRMTVIVAGRGKFTRDVAAMKAANPALKVLAYRNATFGGSGYPDSLYAKDKNGRRIYARKWPTTFLMNISSSAWASTVGKSCVELINASKYDGCFLDVLGSGPLMGNYLSALPVTGGKTWTHNQWIGWADNITAASKAATRKTVMGNGLGNGRRYFSGSMSSKGLVPGNDGMEPELFVREAHSSVGSYYSESSWKQDVDMMIDVQNRGSRVLSRTKLWTTASEAQKNAWHKYALGTFLLGSNGNSLFSFLRDKNAGASWGAHPYNTVNIGTPVAAYAKVGGVYARTFTAGRVVVNPTSAGSTVSLSKAYVTIDGTRVSGTVSVPAHTALILKG